MCVQHLLSSQLNHNRQFAKAKFYLFCMPVKELEQGSSRNLGPGLWRLLPQVGSSFPEQLRSQVLTLNT